MAAAVGQLCVEATTYAVDCGLDHLQFIRQVHVTSSKASPMDQRLAASWRPNSGIGQRLLSTQTSQPNCSPWLQRGESRHRCASRPRSRLPRLRANGQERASTYAVFASNITCEPSQKLRSTFDDLDGLRSAGLGVVFLRPRAYPDQDRQ